MAYLQFGSKQVVKVVDSDEIVSLGQYKFSSNSELKYSRINLLIIGIPGGNERCRLRLHSSTVTSSNYAVTDWVQLSDITNDLSFIRFDWDRPNINKNQWYTVTFEIENYTRDNDDYYLGLLYDNPYYPIYVPSAGGSYHFTDLTLAVQHFGYQ